MQAILGAQEIILNTYLSSISHQFVPQWFAIAQQTLFLISGSGIASCLIRCANPAKFVCQHSLHFLDFSTANRV